MSNLNFKWYTPIVNSRDIGSVYVGTLLWKMMSSIYKKLPSLTISRLKTLIYTMSELDFTKNIFRLATTQGRVVIKG